MKNIKILMLFMLTAFAISCSDDETSLGSVTNANPAGNISALFTITQDNTGLVTITPNAEGAVRFEVYDGDGATEPIELLPGQNMQHIYAEGVYPVKIVAYDITGKSSEATQELTVTFRAPENIEITATPVAGNSFGIDLKAKADYETFFEVTFGETGETPIPFNEGQTVNHIYSAIGTYTITVVAYSGGVATSTATTEVTILDPLKLPLDFESATLTYSFIDFGGCATSLADNPDATGANTSAKVGHMVKNAGEVWAGTAIQLEEVIDFTTYKAVKMKVWSPAAGIPVTLKVENAADAGINFENQQFTTVANAWQTLVFDYSAIDASQEFSKLVIFFNLGTSGSGESYYFDDIEQTVSPLSITFETAVNMSAFGNAVASSEVNPDQTGINTSANVGKFEKTNGAETWAGVAFPQDLPLDFSVLKKVKIKVWSPQAGIPVLLKFEKGGDSQVFMEKIQNTTVANAWEELTYDYSDVIDSSVPYQTPVVFFNFGATGDGSIYYFDDIKQSN